MASVVTLTPNPAVDLSTSVDRIVPMLKLRCTTQRRDPGGGGINVARVVKRFGGDVEAVLPAGGATGDLLRRLIDAEGVPNRIVPVEAETREDFSVTELSTGSQYRFVLPGQPLQEPEWHACLDALAATTPPPRLVVGSGSLPPGVPSDFYARAAAIAANLGARFFLDTSGPALAAAIEHGVTLIKPSLNEMRQLIGAKLADQPECIAAARRLIGSGRVEVVVLSLAHLGAVLITKDQVLRAPAIPIEAKSSVGAGDSFLGAMVFSIARGDGIVDAFRLGAAAGAAALIHEGTELCLAAEAYRLSARVQIESL
jgi:6-phosphofructokinase 2